MTPDINNRTLIATRHHNHSLALSLGSPSYNVQRHYTTYNHTMYKMYNMSMVQHNPCRKWCRPYNIMWECL